jgi:hypothetical protein
MPHPYHPPDVITIIIFGDKWKLQTSS